MVKDHAFYEIKNPYVKNIHRYLKGWKLIMNKPTKNGVYQTDSAWVDERFYEKFGYPEYQHWNGEHWGGVCDTPELAGTEARREYHSPYQDRMWKEITK